MRSVTLLILLLLLQACAASPRDRIIERAVTYGLHQAEIESVDFRHLIFRNFTSSKLLQLHVYLEGDGQPWILRYFQSADPTPRRPMMLSLMAQDRTPSLYLGRPCYNENKRSENCTQVHWTSGRYSAEVVNSMSSVLVAEVERLGANSVTLFGHSGGGALALLIAENIPQVDRVVTLAGNLDTDAWIEHHGYSKLYSSLNPATRDNLPTDIEQIHFMGGRDSNIPPTLGSQWVMNQPNSYGVIIEQFSHGCCWSEIWSGVLTSLRKSAPYTFPGRIFKRPEQRLVNPSSNRGDWRGRQQF